MITVIIKNAAHSPSHVLSLNIGWSIGCFKARINKNLPEIIDMSAQQDLSNSNKGYAASSENLFGYKRES